MNQPFAIEVDGLRKSYGAATVLDAIDLRVAAGNVFALLGPNGAGKTTAVRILATLVRPDGGSARVGGHDVVADRHAVRRLISLTGQYAAVDELQTGIENLEMIGRLRRLGRRAARDRATELIERFDLAAAGHRRVATYSGGMRRRLDLAASLVGHPEVIFLDEPTTGLDPRSRQAMWEVVAGLARDGVTVFLTTQQLEEADRLADTIAVLDGGQIVADGTARQLKRRFGRARLDLELTDASAFEELTGQLGSRTVHSDRASLTLAIPTDGGAEQVRALLDELDPAGIRIARFDVRQASLDDVFLTLTGAPASAPPISSPESETADV